MSLDIQSDRRARYTLLLLASLIFLSYVDRSVISLFVEPLKRDIGISDGQVAFLFGAMFAVVFAVSGLAFGRLADQSSRRILISAAVAVWSACTVASAFAQSFEMLLVLRAGLAIGEAALSPCAASLIGDLFPPPRRALAASVFLAAAALGNFGSHLVGGLLIGLVDPLVARAGGLATWRVVLVAIGVPGLVLAALFAASVKEPARHLRSDATLRKALMHLVARRRLFLGLFVGVGFTLVVLFAYSAWLPTLLLRRFGWSAAESGVSFGSIAVAGSVLGAFLIPAITEHMRRTGRADALPTMAALSAAAGLALAALAPLLGDPRALLALLGLAMVFLVGATTLANIAVQFIVPPDIRGLSISIYLLLSTGLGLGLGPSLTVLLSTALFPGPNALGHGLAALSASMLPMSAWLILSTRASFVTEAQRVAQAEAADRRTANLRLVGDSSEAPGKTASNTSATVIKEPGR